MSARYDTTERFFRPADVAALRRNQRRIQIQRIILAGSRVLAVAAVLAGAGWIWRHTQSDARFALKTIEVTGAVHTPRAAVDAEELRQRRGGDVRADAELARHGDGGKRVAHVVLAGNEELEEAEAVHFERRAALVELEVARGELGARPQAVANDPDVGAAALGRPNVSRSG